MNFTNGDVGVSAIRNKLQKSTSLDLFKYAEDYLQQLEENGKYSNYKKNKAIISKLKLYTKKKTLSINNITIDFIKRYENYLIYELKNGTNTIHTNMKVLRKLVNDIYRNYNLNEINNPFKKYSFKSEQTNRPFLLEEEVNRIRDLKLNLLSPLYDTREMFLVECNSGLRISDILCLNWGNYNGNELTIRIRKTEKYLTIPLSDLLKRLIEKRRLLLLKNGVEYAKENYIFNFLKINIETASNRETLNAISSATAIINKKLKKIAKLAKIDKPLSTHVARHTFATLLMTKGAEIYQIKELLGHSNVKTTQIYAKLIDEKRQKAINLLND